MITILLALSCATEPAPAVVEDPVDEVTPLAAPRLLRRLSLDLRGVVPSLEELDAVEADPARLEDYRDAWLDDPRLEQRLVEMLAEQWRTRVDEFDARWYDYDLTMQDEFAFDQSVGEEPLRLMARVAMLDLPWSDTVTTDVTMVNPMLASIWPVSYPAGASGWQEGRYTDGRPAAGVLTTNGLWWRYSTNPFNLGRSRAAAILRHLLCEDFLARPVSFAPVEDVTTQATSTNAALGDPYCLACHAALEPLAAATFGFWWRTQYSAIEMRTYHAEREGMGEAVLGVAPAYFGAPLTGLADLGAHVAADPRFHRCAVETAGSMLLRRALVAEDHDHVNGWLAAYHASGDRYKAALRAITDDPMYRAGGVPDEAPEAAHQRASTLRLLSVDQLQSSIEDLSGYRWTSAGYEMLGTDIQGYRVLGGGMDGMTVVRAQQDPSVSWALVIERLAQAGADAWVTRELAPGATPRELTLVTREDRPGSDAFRAQLRALYWRLYAERADESWLVEAEALWSAALAREGSPEQAWIVLLATMLRDPLWVGT